MITATEARKLSESDLETHLKFIEDKIKSACKSCETEVIVRDNPYCWWLYSGTNNLSIAEKKTLTALEEAGFHLELHYEERQFADVGLKISWK